MGQRFTGNPVAAAFVPQNVAAAACPVEPTIGIDKSRDAAGAGIHQITFTGRMGGTVSNVHIMGYRDAPGHQRQVTLQQGLHGGLVFNSTQPGKTTIERQGLALGLWGQCRMQCSCQGLQNTFQSHTSGV